VTFVEDGDANVTVVDWEGVVGPVVVALLSPLFDATRQHDYGPGVALPAHPPEVVAGRVKRTLGHNELSR